MTRTDSESFAKEVPGKEALVSRWSSRPSKANAPREPPSETPAHDPPQSKPLGTIPPHSQAQTGKETSHQRESAPLTETKPPSKLESKWATAGPRSADRSDNPPPKRDDNGGSGRPRHSNGLHGPHSGPRPPIQPPTQNGRTQHKKSHQSDGFKSHHNSDHNGKEFGGGPASSRSLSKGANTNDGALRNNPPKQSASSRHTNSHRPAANKSRNKPQGNRLAAHLDQPAQPQTPVTQAAAPSSWSLEGYEPGEDWAEAEEDAFIMQK